MVREAAAEAKAGEAPGTFEPLIVGYLCNWCSYAGSDMAGTSRARIKPNVRTVRVMCSGRVSPDLILRTFREGADGVMVLGCHIGDCHYTDGNHRTIKRIPILKKLLDYSGIDSRRLYLNWVSASEGDKYAAVVNEFVEQVRELGPLPEGAKR